MKTDYWKPHKEALRALTIENVSAALALRGKTWWTVGELAEECRQRRCRAEHPETGRGYYFDCLPRRIQYALVESALRAIKADRCLGSDDGREVRVYRKLEGQGHASSNNGNGRDKGFRYRNSERDCKVPRSRDADS